MTEVLTARRAGLGRGLAGATWRNTLRLSRNAASIVSAFIIPGLFLLAFWAVFGHAADTVGFDYALFLMAACMFQAVMFAAGGSALALAEDVESGLLARMRTMPISAVVAVGGRLGADLLRCLASVGTAVVLGLWCGAEPDSWQGLLAGAAVALVMGQVLALLFCGTALRSRHPVQVASAIQSVEMPLLTLSTAFIPVETLPDWLEPVVRHMPFSPMIDTTRALVSGDEIGQEGWEALAWLTGGLVLGAVWVARAMRRQA